jgi:hypothetical protein
MAVISAERGCRPQGPSRPAAACHHQRPEAQRRSMRVCGPVVGDEHEGRALFARQLQHQVEHRVRRFAVEVAGGLVGQHAGRLR